MKVEMTTTVSLQFEFNRNISLFTKYLATFVLSHFNLTASCTGKFSLFNSKFNLILQNRISMMIFVNVGDNFNVFPQCRSPPQR